MISSIYPSITFAGFFSSASASSNFVGYIEPLLGNIAGGKTIAMIIITIILSYNARVCELYLKQIALQMPLCDGASYCRSYLRSNKTLFAVCLAFCLSRPVS